MSESLSAIQCETTQDLDGTIWRRCWYVNGRGDEFSVRARVPPDADFEQELDLEVWLRRHLAPQTGASRAQIGQIRNAIRQSRTP